MASRYDMSSKKSLKASKQSVATLAAICSVLFLELGALEDNDVL